MNTQRKPKGPWIHRFSIAVFTIVLGVLFFWVLGFLVNDIDSIPGPQYNQIEAKYVDQQLVDRRKALQENIADIERQAKNKKDEIDIISASSKNLQDTIGQLIELKKLTIEKSVALPEAEQSSLSSSLTHFLDSQKLFQTRNTELATLAGQKQKLQEELIGIERRLDEQRHPALEEYNRLDRKHRLYLASLQLAILLPLLAIGAWFFVRKRSSIYFPLVLGCGAATLVKVMLVIHKYFPARYFKYILIGVLLIAVLKLLVSFIRMAAFPKAQWLFKQYREAYERFLCPICEYPIRTGPRRFLFWTRRTVNKFVLPQAQPAPADELYSCPSCGARLFEECPACHKVRHAMLPYCQHCNAEKEMTEFAESTGKKS